MSGDRTADLRVYDGASEPVTRWLRDLDDLLGALAVAGLAWPDPDLESDLRALADRGVAIGASEGAGRLRELGVCVAAVREPGNRPRTDLEGRAFGALMQVVSWLRRARVELDLVAVQAALVVRGTSAEAPRRPRGPVASVRLVPVGVELVGERLGIHAVDFDDGSPWLLMDQLVELDDADPVGHSAISRLFQERVVLSEVLDGLIALDEHPVAMRGGVGVVRPAFDRAPVRRPLSVGADRPSAPAVPEDGWPATGVPASSVLGFGREGPRVVVRDAKGELLSVPETAVLRFTATKFAIAVGGVGAVRGVIRARKASRALVGVELEDGTRCWPAIDPRALPLSATNLLERLEERDDAGSLWLRAVLARRRDTPERVVGALAGFTPSGLVDAYRLGRAAAAVGMPIPAMCLGLASETLAAADADPDDRWRALWIVLSADALDRYRPLLERAWTAHYAKAPSDPTPGDLCARTLLMDELQLGGTEIIGPSDRALSWIDAHLAALRLSARAREPRLPTLEALAWLAETRLLLTGEGGRSPLALFDLPADRLRLEAIEALWHTFESPDLDSSGVAGDAVWALLLAGLGPQLFGD